MTTGRMWKEILDYNRASYHSPGLWFQKSHMFTLFHIHITSQSWH